MHARVLCTSALFVAVLSVLVGCTAGAAARPSAQPSPAATPSLAVRAAGATPDGTVPIRLTPSIPGIFRTGVNFCGDPYAINATTEVGTIPLLDCPGLADAGRLPVLHVRIGAQLLISGLRGNAWLTVRPHRALARDGDTFTARRRGRAVIVIHDYECAPPHGRTCPLVAIGAR